MVKKFSQFIVEDWEPTARFHTELNPVLWNKDSLKPEIRQKLLKFAWVWADFAHIPPNMIDDILLVGGSAGYNYTDKSDIDVHILLERNKLGDRRLVDELLQAKKSLWGLQHDVKVAGLSVEGYAQDHAEVSPKSQGVFSLKDNKWIKRPQLPPIVDTTSPAFKAKVQTYIDRIEHLMDSGASAKSFKEMKNKLKELRAAGLRHGGEYDQGNLIFKTLRDLGVLDKMTKFVRSSQDKKLSY